MAHGPRWRWLPKPSRMSSSRIREPTVLSPRMLITKTLALVSAQKTAMIGISSHVSEWFKLRSLCLAWRGEVRRLATPLHSVVRSHQTVRTAGCPHPG
jgi:hypothetical protein